MAVLAYVVIGLFAFLLLIASLFLGAGVAWLLGKPYPSHAPLLDGAAFLAVLSVLVMADHYKFIAPAVMAQWAYLLPPSAVVLRQALVKSHAPGPE